MPYPQISSDQRQAIARFIEAVVHQAERDADLVGRFLLSHGYRPMAGTGKGPDASMQPSPATNAASILLLDLAAVLRIASWEQQGIKPRLPETVPDSTVALNATLAAASDVSNDRGALQPGLHRQVFELWLKHFARQGHRELGIDVIVMPSEVDRDMLLDTLAELLWQHRHLSHTSEDTT